MRRQLETFKKARELIARPGGWTQGEYARDEEGEPVPLCNSDVDCFCALGALFFKGATPPDIHLLETTVEGPIAYWNDDPDRTQEEVVEAFDKVISKLEETQS